MDNERPSTAPRVPRASCPSASSPWCEMNVIQRGVPAALQPLRSTKIENPRDELDLVLNTHIDELLWAREQRIKKRQGLDERRRYLYSYMTSQQFLSPMTCVLCYNHIIQLNLMDAPYEDSGDPGVYKRLVVSVHMPDIWSSARLDAGCVLRASGITNPCIRNVFQFLNARGHLTHHNNLLYGLEIIIKLFHCAYAPLYIESVIDCPMEEIGNQESFKVRLTRDLTYNCFFRVLHPNLEIRDDAHFQQVPAQAKFVLEHSLTGKYLAVDYDQLQENLFGMEQMIHLKTHMDVNHIHRRENLFAIHYAANL